MNEHDDCVICLRDEDDEKYFVTDSRCTHTIDLSDIAPFKLSFRWRMIFFLNKWWYRVRKPTVKLKKLEWRRWSEERLMRALGKDIVAD